MAPNSLIAQLGPLDLRFGKYYSPDNEATAYFLAALLAASRLGHLCIQIDEKRVTPSFGDHDALIAYGARLLEGLTVQKNTCWYLERNWKCENSFYYHWKRFTKITYCVEGTLELETVSAEQKNAIEHAIKHPLTVISGGPGTGKTYTAAQIIKYFCHQGVKIALAAPTGKATSHLKQVLGMQEIGAYTLHSLLKKPHFSLFKLIVIDECSMVDAFLMEALFSQLKEGMHLVLLGDVDQLPPVDTGHFFRALASSSMCCSLTTGFRTNKSALIQQAHRARQGEMIPFLPLPRQRELLNLLIEQLPQQVSYSPSLFQFYENQRFLSSLRKGPYGLETLNTLLYQEQKKRGVLCHPIMITQNHTKLGVVNGDMGVMEGERVWLSGGRTFAVWELPSFTIAYVISIHKSQGSEYDHVTILLPEGSQEFGRELVYTALTRAKQQATLYSTQEVLKQTLANSCLRLCGI